MAAAAAAVASRQGPCCDNHWDLDVSSERPATAQGKGRSTSASQLKVARPDLLERAATKQAAKLRAAEFDEASKRHVAELRRANRSFSAVVRENHLLRDAAEKAERRASDEARNASLRAKQQTAPLSRQVRALTRWMWVASNLVWGANQNNPNIHTQTTTHNIPKYAPKIPRLSHRGAYPIL